MDVARFLQILNVQLWMTILVFQKCANAIEIDNGIIGVPTINCATNEIDFWVQTRRPFTGKVYVKGEYGNPDCSGTFTTRTTFNPTDATTPGSGRSTLSGGVCPPCPPCDDSLQRQRRQVDSLFSQSSPTMAHLTVKLGTCNTKRDRQLEPPGVMMGLTIVVSFHEHFVTKVDKAYAVQCMYMEATKTVTSEIDVSMPQTTEINGNAPMPRCEYTIRRETPDGTEIRFARVGDQVYHRWECSSELPEMFGMLVHSCTVEDGQGQKVTIVDEKGCSVDRFVLPNPTYDSLLFAYVEAHVFKFADRAVLDFQCSMTICVRPDGGCDGVTPPACERASSFVARQRRSVNATSSAEREAEASTNQWRLHAPRVTVMDLDDRVDSKEILELEQKFVKRRSSPPSSSEAASRLRSDVLGHRRSTVCLSVAGFGILVSLSTFVFTVAAGVTAAIYVLRTRTK